MSTYEDERFTRLKERLKNNIRLAPIDIQVFKMNAMKEYKNFIYIRFEEYYFRMDKNGSQAEMVDEEEYAKAKYLY